jgi:hypothetical protein
VVEEEGKLGQMAILWDPLKWNIELHSNLPMIMTIKLIEVGNPYQGYLSNVYDPLSPIFK